MRGYHISENVIRISLKENNYKAWCIKCKNELLFNTIEPNEIQKKKLKKFSDKHNKDCRVKN